MRIPDGSLNGGAAHLFSFAPAGSPAGFNASLFIPSTFGYDVGIIVQNFSSGRSLTASSLDGVFSPNATGHHIFFSVDTNHAAGSKLVNLYVDGVNVIDATQTIDSSAAFTIPFSAAQFGVPFLNNPAFFDSANVHLSEVWIACGQYIDPSNISKFRDPVTGLPVSLGSDGSVPTGIRPTYYLTGGASQFQVNAGSGPAVSKAGAISDGTFNTFLDQNPATVFLGNGGAAGGYAGIFQDPCSASDSAFLTISMWVRANPANSDFLNFPNLLALGVNNGTGSAGNTVLLGGNTSGNQADVGCFFTSSSDPINKQVAFSSAGGKFTPNATGHHIFISVDTNHGAGAKLLNIYIDGADAKDNAQTLDSGAAFNIGFKSQNSGTGKFGLPQVDNTVGNVQSDLDYSEVWIACGQYVDPINIGKFRNPTSGAQVNLGANGQTPTGTSPTYYFKGPWSSFSTNLGTGGAVTLINAPRSSAGFTYTALIGDSTWNSFPGGTRVVGSPSPKHIGDKRRRVPIDLLRSMLRDIGSQWAEDLAKCDQCWGKLEYLGDDNYYCHACEERIQAVREQEAEDSYNADRHKASSRLKIPRCIMNAPCDCGDLCEDEEKYGWLVGKG